MAPGRSGKQPDDSGESEAEQPGLPAGLYVVATPIGNLGDLGERARAVLAQVDLIAAEDTRVTARLLRRYAIATRTGAYHEHNAAEARPRLLAMLSRGARIALVSDAGTPLISDPGYRLVRAAHEAAVPVIPVPGPSAVAAALSVAGLPTDRFLFAGFLPRSDAARRAELAELAAIPATLVLLESARRLPASLAAMADVLGNREAVVARELTKTFEEIRRAGLTALAAHYAEAGAPKGEVTLVVAPPQPREASDTEIDAALAAALANGLAVKEAAAAVAASHGISRRIAYARALDLKAQR